MGATPTVERLTPFLGAEVRNVELRLGRDDELAVVHEALRRHHVVVVRGQDLDDPELHAFATSFGEVAPSPDRYVEQRPVDGLYDIDGAVFRADGWHTDLTFEPSPVWLGVLAAKTVPDLGGDTVWSNMCGAYRRLSPPFAAFLGPLDAEHTSAGLGPAGGPLISTIHPVITARPLTGEPVLYVNPLWTQRIVGLARSESAAVLAALHEIAITSPEIEFRHRWRSGDVVVWDMRSTMHRAVDDYGDAERVLRRASVLHEPPRRFSSTTPKGR